MMKPAEPDMERKHRQEMVDRQIRSRGIRDGAVLSALVEIPRERFLPPTLHQEALEDRALPIGNGQTISQPYIVAYMTEKLALHPPSTVLEVGTGSGYQTAVLARLCHHVFSIERVRDLHANAAATLAALGVTNVTLVVADGSLGLREKAPFDRIIVTAAAPRPPAPLIDQLADNGRLIVPIGDRAEQTLYWFDRHGQEIVETKGINCRFVRLIGNEAWSD